MIMHAEKNFQHQYAREKNDHKKIDANQFDVNLGS
jgi:hypothetical protein